MDVKKVLEFALISFTKFFCERKFSCNIIRILIKHVLLYTYMYVFAIIITLVQVDKVCAKNFHPFAQNEIFFNTKNL